MVTKVLNLFAGPGAGKSTMAAGLFFNMKTAGYKVELVTEFAKELVYEGNGHLLRHQLMVTTEQERRQGRLQGKVDWIITDSPLLLGAVYGKGNADAEQYAWAVFNKYDNINVLVERVKPYQTYGRRECEASARGVDGVTREVTSGIIDLTVTGDTEGLNRLYNYIVNRTAS